MKIYLIILVDLNSQSSYIHTYNNHAYGQYAANLFGHITYVCTLAYSEA